MDDTKFWVELKAQCPFTSWQTTLTLIVAMFDGMGNMVSYLTTDDPSSSSKDVPGDRIRLTSKDDISNNIRVRSIQLELVSVTLNTHPPVTSIALGLMLSPSTSLSDFGNSAVGGQLTLALAKAPDQPVAIRDFPLKWMGNKNGCVVGNLIRNINVKRVDKVPQPPSNITNFWFFRYSTAMPKFNEISDLLGLFKVEVQHNNTLIQHNAYSGCVPLSHFLVTHKPIVQTAKHPSFCGGIDGSPLSAGNVGELTSDEWVATSDVNRANAAEQLSSVSRDPLKDMYKTVTSTTGLDTWTVAGLPFDKITFMLHYLNQRMDLQDKNLQDFWKMLNFLKMEADFNDDQLAIVGTLARRLEDFEHLIMQMYSSTAEKTLEIKEMLNIRDSSDSASSDQTRRYPLQLGSDFSLEGSPAGLEALKELKAQHLMDESIYEYEQLVRNRRKAEHQPETARLINGVLHDYPHRRQIPAAGTFFFDDNDLEKTHRVRDSLKHLT